MIITISGVPGSGKSTVGKLVAKKLGYAHYSVGDLMRELAKKKSMTMLELSSHAESDRSVDDYLDKRQKEISRGDKIVLDSRLGYHFIPKSFKVFLDASPREAGRRIFQAQREEEKENLTLEKTIVNTKARKNSERLRYKRLYKQNPFLEKNYDLVIDTTKLLPQEVADKIVKLSKGQYKSTR